VCVDVNVSVGDERVRIFTLKWHSHVHTNILTALRLSVCVWVCMSCTATRVLAPSCMQHDLRTLLRICISLAALFGLLFICCTLPFCQLHAINFHQCNASRIMQESQPGTVQSSPVSRIWQDLNAALAFWPRRVACLAVDNRCIDGKPLRWFIISSVVHCNFYCDFYKRTRKIDAKAAKRPQVFIALRFMRNFLSLLLFLIMLQPRLQGVSG